MPTELAGETPQRRERSVGQTACLSEVASATADRLDFAELSRSAAGPTGAPGQVTIIGAGANGAGCIGTRAHGAGYHVVFVDSYAPSVRFVRDHYAVKSVGLYKARSLVVTGVEAHVVRPDEQEAILAAIVASEAVFLAAGPANHPDYAELIAKALEEFLRTGEGAKNLIFCENQRGSGKLFKQRYLNGLFARHEDAGERIGLVDTVIHIMSRRDEDVIVSEDYDQIPYDADGARGAMPAIPDLKPYRDFQRMEERKLFTHNLLHSAIGYAAHLRNIQNVAQAGDHGDIMDLAIRATDEAILGLAREYGGRYREFASGTLTDLRDEMLARTLNPVFDDVVTRLTRGPIRKLARDERMVGPALLAEKHGVEPESIATVIGCALRYDDPEDAESVELQQKLRARGAGHCLTEVCGLEASSVTYRLVAQQLEGVLRRC